MAMPAHITMKSAPGAEGIADQAIRAFRRETQGLDAYLDRIQVSLGEAEGPEGRDLKTVRVRVDFRSGGCYLVEAEGEDWSGLLPAAARRAAQGSERALRQRWEMAET